MPKTRVATTSLEPSVTTWTLSGLGEALSTMRSAGGGEGRAGKSSRETGWLGLTTLRCVEHTVIGIRSGPYAGVEIANQPGKNKRRTR